MHGISIAVALVALAPDRGHEHGPQLGRVKFETSCAAAARPALQRGLGWLHSFEYEEAERAFAAAAAADPRCAIALWGTGMTFYHPLWAPPTPDELRKGSEALAKAQSVGARSARERDMIDALAVFYGDYARLDHKTRALAHMAAMERLHANYPGDDEIAVFYALSLIAAGTMDNDPHYGREKSAAAILERVLARQPDHPGVAHYLIHSFDYPPLARFALPAARRYAAIAPASAHAQHMPSHIFARLGLWDEMVRSNLSAETSARAYAAAHDMPGSWDERLHAMDYLMYGYLQSAQDGKARALLDELGRIERVDPPNFKVAFAASAMPARYALERRRWGEAAALALTPGTERLVDWRKFPWAQAQLHFARAIGAARSADPVHARQEVAKLAAIERTMTVPPGEYDWRKQVTIERMTAAAWLAFAEGRGEEAASTMRAAAELDDATEKHPVTPGSILPAREQLGELLLELGKPADALVAFESSLARAPKRLGGLYGAARAARLGGDDQRAQAYFAELLVVAKAGDGARPEIVEARSAVVRPARR